MTSPYRVLARKYRPQTLSELVGQDVLVKTLAHGIASNRLPHAFILHGIRGVGKTTTARILAKALNCDEGPTASPCGVCPSCVAIQEDRHLDVVEMDAASRTGVDDVREVIEASRYKAVNGRYKIYIIDEVHMLSRSAFNALLKTLEEPPPHVKFIFATTELKKVPDTVLSRCMKFDLARLSPQLLLNHLKSITEKESVTIEDDALSLIVRSADGSARDALSLLDQAIALSGDAHITANSVRNMLGLVDRGRIFKIIESLFKGDVDSAFQEIRDLFSHGGDPIMMTRDLLDVVYWITCLKTSPKIKNDPTYPESDRRQGFELAEKLSMPALMRAWQVLGKGYEEIHRSPLPLQSMEMVLIRLCYLSNLPSAEDLLSAVQGNGSVNFLPKNASSETGAPATFQGLLTMLSEAREPILYSHMIHDVHLVDYQPGKLTIRLLKDMVPSQFVDQLKTILNKETKMSWDVILSDDEGQKTIGAQKKEEHETQIEASKSHPVVQSFLNNFPESTMIIQKES